MIPLLLKTLTTDAETIIPVIVTNPTSIPNTDGATIILPIILSAALNFGTFVTLRDNSALQIGQSIFTVSIFAPLKIEQIDTKLIHIQ